MNDYRFSLDRSSKKYECPQCHKKKLVRYIDKENNTMLSFEYGRCDSEASCAYHLNPYKNGYAKMIFDEEKGIEGVNKPFVPRPDPKTVQPLKKYYIPLEVLKMTYKDYDKNIFIQNLLKNIKYPFKASDIEKIIENYHLGTVSNGYRSGAITFPFIDENNNIRAIQVKEFDKTNHTLKRNGKSCTTSLTSLIEQHHKKQKTDSPQWLNDYNKNELKFSCFFGAHLLKQFPGNPVALVEAPKTAIYGSLYFGMPKNESDLLWLAVYNLSSLTLDKCKALEGRNVYLFPDLSKTGKAFNQWSNKAKEIQKAMNDTRFIISDLLEKNATKEQRIKGGDLADYLIELDWRSFRTE